MERAIRDGGCPQSNAPRVQRVHFITTSNPAAAVGSNNRRQTRSFLARQAHARVRRARVLAHQQAAKASRFVTHLTAPPVPGTASDTSSTVSGQSCQASSSATDRIIYGALIPVLGSGYGDPFDTLALRCNPFEQFLLHHYTHFILPNAEIFYPNMGRGALRRNLDAVLVPFSLARLDTISSLLLIACRSLASLYEDHSYNYHAMRYRQECLHSVTFDIGNGITDATIITTLHLGIDEFHGGDLKAVQVHNQGLAQMVTSQGGIDELGLSGILGELVLW